MFGHFSTTLLGLDTIRSFGVEEVFTDQMNAYQDAHTRAWFSFIATSAWLSYRLDLLCVVFICFVALVSPALRSCKFHINPTHIEKLEKHIWETDKGVSF